MYNVNLAKEYKLHSFMHLDIINHFQEETTNIQSPQYHASQTLQPIQNSGDSTVFCGLSSHTFPVYFNRV